MIGLLMVERGKFTVGFGVAGGEISHSIDRKPWAVKPQARFLHCNQIRLTKGESCSLERIIKELSQWGQGFLIRAMSCCSQVLFYNKYTIKLNIYRRLVLLMFWYMIILLNPLLYPYSPQSKDFFCLFLGFIYFGLFFLQPCHSRFFTGMWRCNA